VATGVAADLRGQASRCLQGPGPLSALLHHGRPTPRGPQAVGLPLHRFSNPHDMKKLFKAESEKPHPAVSPWGHSGKRQTTNHVGILASPAQPYATGSKLQHASLPGIWARVYLRPPWPANNPTTLGHDTSPTSFRYAPYPSRASACRWPLVISPRTNSLDLPTGADAEGGLLQPPLSKAATNGRACSLRPSRTGRQPMIELLVKRRPWWAGRKYERELAICREPCRGPWAPPRLGPHNSFTPKKKRSSEFDESKTSRIWP